jgi:hypothetical protein
MPRELRPVNPRPLSESEEHTLRSLLDRRAENLPEAQARRDKERALERKLREKSDRLAAEEARLAKRLAQLHVDLDTVSAKLFQLSSSGVAFRSVNEQLQKLAQLVPTQSFFNSRFDTFDRDQIQLLGEIALSLHAQATRPKGTPLRERMGSVKVDIGPGDPDGPGAAPDDRTALARAAIAAARKARPGT